MLRRATSHRGNQILSSAQMFLGIFWFWSSSPFMSWNFFKGKTLPNAKKMDFFSNHRILLIGAQNMRHFRGETRRPALIGYVVDWSVKCYNSIRLDIQKHWLASFSLVLAQLNSTYIRRQSLRIENRHQLLNVRYDVEKSWFYAWIVTSFTLFAKLM